MDAIVQQIAAKHQKTSKYIIRLQKTSKDIKIHQKTSEGIRRSRNNDTPKLERVVNQDTRKFIAGL